MSLVTKLLLLISAIVLSVMLIMGFYIIQNVKKIDNEQVQRLLHSYLNLAEARFNDRAEFLIHNAIVTAQNPDVQGVLQRYQPQDIATQLNNIVALYPYLTYILVIDMDADILAASDRDSSGSAFNTFTWLGESSLNHPLFPGSSSTQTLISNPGIDPWLPQQNRLQQWIMAPVIQEGDQLGWVVLSFDWQTASEATLLQLTKEQNSQGSAIVDALITNKNNIVIVSSSTSQEGKPFLANDKMRVVSQQIKVANQVMDIYLVHDKAQLNAAINYSERLLLGMVIVMTLMLIIALYWGLQRYLFNRIAILQQGTEQLDNGNFDYRLPNLGQDELGKLGIAFNQLAEGLAHSKAQLEHEKQTLDQRILDRTQELEVANKKAEASAKAKSEFLAAMSHEIRTPMNGVLGMTQLLQNSDLNDRQKEYADIIYQSGSSLLIIINDILDFSKIEAGQLSLDKLPFDLEKECHETCQSLSLQADDKGLELLLDYDINCPTTVIGDALRIRQLLVNLIGNAIKFTQQGSISVKVSSEQDQNGLNIFSLAVIDTGIGIPKHIQPHLFSSFTQADSSTTRKYGGTGLGLAICKQLCELMGGQINLQSVEGKGSTFTVSLPLGIHSTQALNNHQPLNGKKVLVVDDNQLNLDILKRMLQPLEMNISFCSDPIIALDRLTKSANTKPFQLLISDYKMPAMDGAELVTSVRNIEKYRDIPILVLSSSCHLDDSQKLQQARANKILSKPVIRNILFSAIDSVCRNNNQKPIFSSANSTHAKVERLSGHILLAEDVVTNQLVATAMLEQLGLTVDIANNGLEALEKWRNGHYQLILMDCQMPILDGYQATARILAEDPSKTTPIIALTANALPADRERCFNVGMDDFLPKPFEQQALANLLNYWLSKTKPEPHHLEPTSNIQELTMENNTITKKSDNLVELSTFEMLKNAMGNNFNMLIDAFITSLDEQLINLPKSIQDNDLKTYVREVHSMKSASANFGFNEFSALNRKLELNGSKEGQFATEAELADLADQVTKIKQWLKENAHSA
ncbi:response regulator [Motilimonas cestriensis]|uniref:histidine kinase n=1 Tax=Motilimonas cestriensis TaxID=2742685 RepID=A0ABS8W7T2_9GAMM|nr:response regulator [Motilimonas cestriensis]MCE2593869.1 response regulator [Motilimonas cestriensis]